jgi:hypothetical protein
MEYDYITHNSRSNKYINKNVLSRLHFLEESITKSSIAKINWRKINATKSIKIYINEMRDKN